MPTDIRGTNARGEEINVTLTGDAGGLHPGPYKWTDDLGGGQITVINLVNEAECTGTGYVVLYTSLEESMMKRRHLYDESQPVTAAGTEGKVTIKFHKNGRKEA